MRSIARLIKKEDTLYVLTADHGCMPIPELLALEGYPAKRVLAPKIMSNLNKEILEQFGVENLVKNYKTPQFFLDEPKLKSLDPEAQANILRTIKQSLQTVPGIKQAWTFDDLKNTTYPIHSFEDNYKQQLYPGRSGLITVQPHPYCPITNHDNGTGHKTPYRYDTGVPLILYRKNALENKRIPQQVWIPQIAPTLAALLDVLKPSSATFDVLPEIFG